MERGLRQRLTTVMHNMVFIQSALLWLASGLIGWSALGCAPAAAPLTPHTSARASAPNWTRGDADPDFYADS